MAFKFFVNSLCKLAGIPLKGDVTLSEGANVTITQVGQDIAIAAAGGGGGDVVGPANSAVGEVAIYGDTTGKLLIRPTGGGFIINTGSGEVLALLGFRTEGRTKLGTLSTEELDIQAGVNDGAGPVDAVNPSGWIKITTLAGIRYLNVYT